MHNVELIESFRCPAAALWDIVGTLDRVDWVPSVDRAEMRGTDRHMHMEGAGALVERIYQHEPEARVVEYGVVESAVGITHHRARIEVMDSADGCTLRWALAVEPDAFGPMIESTMQTCLTELHTLLDTEAG